MSLKRISFVVVLAVVFLLSVSSAFAAASIEVLSITKPTGLPANCGGDVTVTIRYSSTQLITIDYEVTLPAPFPPITGTVNLPSTGGADQVLPVPFTGLPPIPLNTQLTIDATVSDFFNTTIILGADAVNYYCQNGYPAAPTTGGPKPPTVPPVIVEPEPPSDGRTLSVSDVKAVVYYNKDGTFDIYTVNPDSTGSLAIHVEEAELDALPEFPATNILIAKNADGTIAFYKLTSGQYQINIGPDPEGKVRVYIFNGFPVTNVFVTEFIVTP